MQRNPKSLIRFNLWEDAWIPLEKANGEIVLVGIRESLLNASHYGAIYESSPLVVASIHRLLSAVLQFIYNPQTASDLISIRKTGYFPPEAIENFGEKYSKRFDLFSEKEPFYQSADLPLEPRTQEYAKSIAYLFPDLPNGTEITHYHHKIESDYTLCPTCVAQGLVCLPAFATPGGKGFRPSINGVPPLYILPGGNTLFESLFYSVLLPDYLPEAASKKDDLAWWIRPAKVIRDFEMAEVGYIHSLTFQARRVRLHPTVIRSVCSRCGKTMELGVKTMVFEMGESRPKNSPFWMDPFVAYRKRIGNSPMPVRPNAEIALWREIPILFLQTRKNETVRPVILDQMIDLESKENKITREMLTFRCIGLRTDMKAKIYEWTETVFTLPFALLNDREIGYQVEEALHFATKCGTDLDETFTEVFGGKTRKANRFRHLKNFMMEDYWTTLSDPFRDFIKKVVNPDERRSAQLVWIEMVSSVAIHSFSKACNNIGNDATNLHLRGQAEQRFYHYLEGNKGKELKSYEFIGDNRQE